ncbi:MAG: polysaccharide biosynthesis protein [Acidobacteriaceae bacterium]|nr:polysaccharide biosynthesis protein [Acidobacteriaceae bacterium]
MSEAIQSEGPISPADRVEHNDGRLLRDALWNSLGFLTAGFAGMLLVPLLLHRLGAAAYGLWIVASSAGSMVLILEGGLGWALTREIAAKDDWTATQQFVRAAGSFYLVLGCLGAIVGIASAFFLPQRLHVEPALLPAARAVFYFAAIAFLVEQLFGFKIAILQGLRRFDLANSVSNLTALLRIAAIALLLWFGFGIVSVAVVTAATGLAGVLIASIVVHHAEPRLRLFPLTLGWRPLLSSLRFSITSHIGYTLSYWTWQLPPLIIGFLRGSGAVTPYFIGQRLSIAASAIAHRSGESLFPAASEAGAAGDLSAIVRFGNRAVAFTALPISALLFIFAPEILRVWLGAVPPEASVVLRLTAAAAGVESLGIAAMYTLWGAGHSVRILAILSGIGLGSVSLGGWWLSLFGISGVALAILVVLALGTVVFSISAVAETGISVKQTLDSFLPLLLPLISLVAIALALRFIYSPNSVLGLVASLCPPAAVYLVLSGVFLPPSERSILLRPFLMLRNLLDHVRVLRSAKWFIIFVWHWLSNSRQKVYEIYSAVSTMYRRRGAEDRSSSRNGKGER